MATNQPAAAGRDRRQFERWDSDEGVELIHAGDRYPAKLDNASAGGLAVKSAAPVNAGDTVSIAFRGLPDAAMTVVRRDGDRIALKFLDGPNYHFR